MTEKRPNSQQHDRSYSLLQAERELSSDIILPIVSSSLPLANVPVRIGPAGQSSVTLVVQSCQSLPFLALGGFGFSDPLQPLMLDSNPTQVHVILGHRKRAQRTEHGETVTRGNDQTIPASQGTSPDHRACVAMRPSVRPLYCTVIKVQNRPALRQAEEACKCSPYDTAVTAGSRFRENARRLRPSRRRSLRWRQAGRSSLRGTTRARRYV